MRSNQFKHTSVLVLFLLLVSCANLSSVYKYSTTSLAGLEKFEQIGYSFQGHCLDRCRFEAIRNFEIKRQVECACANYAEADEVTQRLYDAIRGYFFGLANISNNGLTDYNFDALNKSLVEGQFGDVKIEKEQVEAYSKISKILLKAVSDLYRKKKIRQYLEEANEPIQILTKKFQFILEKNLAGTLDFKKEKLFAYYKEMNLQKTLTDYEKGKATSDYYDQLAKADLRQQAIHVFAESVGVIAAGHQQLYDNRNKLTTKELKEQLVGYASKLRDLVSEFNKL